MAVVLSYKNPVLKKGKHIVTSPFGMRTITVNGKTSTKMHNGIDLVAEGHTLDYIIAFADGTVTVSRKSDSAGEYVKIDHGNGYCTRYLHMRSGSRTVKVGQAVKKGQVLGYMGATGNVTGAHLHFDIALSGSYLDPEPYLLGTKELDMTPNSVKAWQLAAIADGFSFPKYGADGKWGAECEAVAKKAICKYRWFSFKYPNLTKLIQGIVGVKQDGKYGSDTKTAVKEWQKQNNLTADGEVGIKTWKKLLNIS